MVKTIIAILIASAFAIGLTILLSRLFTNVIGA